MPISLPARLSRLTVSRLFMMFFNFYSFPRFLGFDPLAVQFGYVRLLWPLIALFPSTFSPAFFFLHEGITMKRGGYRRRRFHRQQRCQRLRPRVLQRGGHAKTDGCSFHGPFTPLLLTYFSLARHSLAHSLGPRSFLSACACVSFLPPSLACCLLIRLSPRFGNKRDAAAD